MRKPPRKPQAVIAKQPILTGPVKVTSKGVIRITHLISFTGRMYPVIRLVVSRLEITRRGGFYQDYCFLASFKEKRSLRVDEVLAI